MKTLLSLCLACCAFLTTTVFANTEQGGQYKELGTWQVHYIAFPSTVLQPKIAQHYGIERSNYNAVINISVLDKKSKAAQKVSLSGTAKNLLGHTEKLSFKEIVDGEAIYYIAELGYSNEELYRFNLDIKGQNKTEVLKFQQKFYVD